MSERDHDINAARAVALMWLSGGLGIAVGAVAVQIPIPEVKLFVENYFCWIAIAAAALSGGVSVAYDVVHGNTIEH